MGHDILEGPLHNWRFCLNDVHILTLRISAVQTVLNKINGDKMFDSPIKFPN